MTKKKKIGIVTITNDGYNFGNRLQNYALQTVLERMGFDVETLNRPIRENQQDWWKRKKMVLHYLIPFRRQIVHLKAGNFFFWNKRYIHWSKLVATNKNLPLLAKQYDYFVAGSDQIWNPNYSWANDEFTSLRFAKYEQRLSYAPSLGIESSEFPKNRYKEFAELFSNISALSVREESGAEIIKNIVGKGVPVVLDPTLLLSKNDWDKVCHKVVAPKQYLLIYTIGTLTDEYNSYVQTICTKYNLEIVNILQDKQYAGINPSQFIYLFKNASFIVTDSFHANVFAIIYHKPFAILNRVLQEESQNMTTRMVSLLNMFNITSELPNDINEFEFVDWNMVEKQKITLQYHSYDYLRSIL